MRTRKFDKAIYIPLAILALGVVSVLSLIVFQHVKPPQHDLQVVDILVPARESRAMLYPDEAPFASDDFIIAQQSVKRPAITEPISDRLPQPDLIQHDCGTLSVTIDADRNLSLNTERMGSLNDTAQLASKLRNLFNERVAQHAYQVGMETRTDFPDMERIPRTVLLRPSRSIIYGDVVKLIDLLKELHADPIGLQINRLPA